VVVGVAWRLVPAEITPKQTLNSPLVNSSGIGIAEIAQFSFQCLQITCSSLRLPSIVVVLCIRRLNLRLCASVRVVPEIEAMSSTGMKVRKPEPAEIEYKNMKFLITYRPTDATMDRFIEVSLPLCDLSILLLLLLLLLLVLNVFVNGSACRHNMTNRGPSVPGICSYCRRRLKFSSIHFVYEPSFEDW